jgi:hypothetical protein
MSRHILSIFLTDSNCAESFSLPQKVDRVWKTAESRLPGLILDNCYVWRACMLHGLSSPSKVVHVMHCEMVCLKWAKVRVTVTEMGA